MAERSKAINTMNIIEKCRHLKSSMLGGVDERKGSNRKEEGKEKCIVGREFQVNLTPLKAEQIVTECKVKIIPWKDNSIEKEGTQPETRKSSRIRKPRKILDL